MDDFADFTSSPAQEQQVPADGGFDAFGSDFQSAPPPPTTTAADDSGAVTVGGGDNDEMSQFLAREAALRQQLGETDDGFGGAATADSSGAAASATTPGMAAAPPMGGDDEWANTDANGNVQDTPVFGQSDDTYAQLGEGGGDEVAQSPKVKPQSHAERVMSMIKSSEASEPIKQWRESQKDLVAERDGVATEKKQATLAKARKEIDDFYSEYSEKKEKQIQKNREDEALFLKTRDEEPGSLKFWEQVTSQIDLSSNSRRDKQPAGSAKSDSGNGPTEPKKDLSKYKGLLLQLKNDPNAPSNK